MSRTMYYLLGLTGLLIAVGFLSWGLEKVTDVNEEYHYVRTMTRIQDEDENNNEAFSDGSSTSYDETTLSTVK
jgi:hypothetical protein